MFSDQTDEASVKYREFVTRGVDGSEPVNYSGGGLVQSYGGWESLIPLRPEHELQIGDERILPSCPSCPFNSDGGQTNANNLVMLCTTHHALLHDGHYSIRVRENGKLVFIIGIRLS